MTYFVPENADPRKSTFDVAPCALAAGSASTALDLTARPQQSSVIQPAEAGSRSKVKLRAEADNRTLRLLLACGLYLVF